MSSKEISTLELKEMIKSKTLDLQIQKKLGRRKARRKAEKVVFKQICKLNMGVV
jgi:hypothetical protein